MMTTRLLLAVLCCSLHTVSAYRGSSLLSNAQLRSAHRTSAPGAIRMAAPAKSPSRWSAFRQALKGKSDPQPIMSPDESFGKLAKHKGGWMPDPGDSIGQALTQFEGAMPGSLVHRISTQVLEKRGFTDDNALFGHSTCPDEINHEVDGLPSLMEKTWGEVFYMGGLGGVPFCGAAGFGAFSAHVPQDGNVVILMGPHVAIGPNGEVGKVARVGQTGGDISSACGAAIGAYKNYDALKGNPSVNDLQMGFIAKSLGPYMEKIKASSTDNQEMAQLAKSLYDVVEKQMLSIINSDFGSPTSKLTILGGVQINMPSPYEDFFLPLFFKVKVNNESEWTDLLPEFKKTAAIDAEKLGDSSIGMWNGGWEPHAGHVKGALNKFGRHHLPAQTVAKKTTEVLTSMGFEYENTLYAQSICPDEINHLDDGLPKLLQTQWGTDGQVFHMGGLGGLPFTGSTGFGAFAAHVPTDGNLFIVFAPHVGIGPGGEVGKYLRDGQSSLSTACGAAIGALSGCTGMTPEDLSVYLKAGGVVRGGAGILNADMADKLTAGESQQIQYILSGVSSEVERVNKSEDPMAELAFVMYELSEKMMMTISTMDGWSGPNSKICLLGGIQVNMPEPYEDQFVPLHFSVQAKEGSKKDLLHYLK